MKTMFIGQAPEKALERILPCRRVCHSLIIGNDASLAIIAKFHLRRFRI